MRDISNYCKTIHVRIPQTLTLGLNLWLAESINFETDWDVRMVKYFPKFIEMKYVNKIGSNLYEEMANIRNYIDSMSKKILFKII